MDHKEEKMKDKKMWVFNYVLVTGYMRSALRLAERFSVDQVIWNHHNPFLARHWM